MVAAEWNLRLSFMKILTLQYMFKIFGFNSTYPKQEDSGTHLFIVGVEQPVFRLFSSRTVLPACGPPEVPVNPATANYKKNRKVIYHILSWELFGISVSEV